MIKDNNTISRDIAQAYFDNRYIVTQHSVYQPMYSQAQEQFYAVAVYRTNDNLTKPDRFFHMTGDAVNKLINIKLLNNL